MANLPGTIWQKIVSQFGAPPAWVQVGNFAQGIQGAQGPAGQNGLSIVGPPGPSGISLVPRNFIDGLILANNATANKIDFSAGQCADSTNAIAITNPSTMTKDASVTWAAGNNAGGAFANSGLASNTTYHAFIIAKAGGTSVDFGFDVSATAANKPSGYTYFRRVGSYKTQVGVSSVPAFHQYGDEFWLDTGVLEVSTSPASTSAATYSLTALPLGILIKGMLASNVSSATTASCFYILTSLDSADVAPAKTGVVQTGAENTTVVESFGLSEIWMSNGQLRGRLSSNGATLLLQIRSLGWIDQRGKNGQ